MNLFIKTFRLFILLVLLTGIIYPLITVGFAKLLFNNTSEGDFLFLKEKKIGARLIGQKFDQEHYFWGRPSAIQFNPLPSGGSHLGPTSLVLKNLVEQRKQFILKSHNKTDKTVIPSELVYASGSGIDPDISIAAIEFQFDRVTNARKFDENKKEQLRHKILQLKQSHYFGLVQKTYINLLQLNISVDELEGMKNHE